MRDSTYIFNFVDFARNLPSLGSDLFNCLAVSFLTGSTFEADSTYFSGSVGMRDLTFIFYFVDLASNFFIKIYFIIFIVILICPVFFAKNKLFSLY